MGSWGQDLAPPQQLKDLVLALLKSTDVRRIRLSSLEPWDIDSQVFDLWQDPRLCRHLHLPLQSGSAATLKRMARKTTPRDFSELVAAARSAIPDVAITTDIITGFPGEKDEEFTESLDFVRRMSFAGGHVFTFSSRPGTAAADMVGQVPFSVRKSRNAQMRAAFEESARRYKENFIGEVMPVLWESATALGPDEWLLSGLTDNYLRVETVAHERLWNQVAMVKLVELVDMRIKGELKG